MTHRSDGTNDKLRAALTHDDALDDVKRARIWANLDARLDVPVATHRWRWPIAFAVAASTAAVLGIVMRHGGGDEVRTLVAPAEATLDAPLGPHARVRLVGPAQLDVLGPAADATTVRLSTGTLYAQFDGGPGRSLTIVTTAAVIEVVGTVFAVEIRDDDTCISVAHGRIRATSRRGAWFVATGEHRCSRDAAVSPIDPRVNDALARHEAVIAAASSSTSATASTAPSTNGTVSVAPPSPNNATSLPSGPTPNAAAASNQATTPANPPPSGRTTGLTPPTTASASNRAPPPMTMRASSLVPPLPDDATASRAPAPPSNAIAASNRAVPPSTPTTIASSSPSNRATPPPANVAPSPSVSSSIPRSNGAASPSDSGTPSSRAVATAVPPPAPTEPTPPPDPTAADLYRTAEAALARRDLAGADRALARLVTDMPASPLVDQALYERARIAFSRRAWGEARRHLDALAALGASSLTEPGRYLACRVAVEAHDSSARRCLIEYRATYPKSPHDADARAMLSRLPEDPE